MTRWPALRTPTGGLTGLTLPKLLLAMLICLAAPMAIGLALVFSAAPLGQAIGYAGDGPIFTLAIGLFLVYSPILAWIGLVPGVPLFLLAMARGWAGWVVSLCVGGLIGLVLSALVDTSSVFALFGAFNAIVFWCALRGLHPTGFVRA